MSAKNPQSRSPQLTPSSGRRRSKWPDGVASFQVSAFALGAESDCAYRIFDPMANVWGAWLQGQDPSQEGVITTVLGLPTSASIAFPLVVNAPTDTIVESNTVVISDQGHLLQLRRRSSVLYSTTRVMTAVVDDVSYSWSIITQEDTLSEPGSAEPSPLPLGTEYFIATATQSFNASSLNPGDIITINGGERPRLTITNAVGTAANPILIRNNPASTARVTFRNPSPGTNFLFTIDSCKHVIIDGLFKWQGAPSGLTYGLYCTRLDFRPNQDEPQAFMKVGGTYSDVKLRGIEIDGKVPEYGPSGARMSTTGLGMGLSMNQADMYLQDHPGLWRENVLIEYCRIRNPNAEGMYLGPNVRTPRRIPLRNWTIRYNYVENTGKECIQIKSCIQGNNSIHHNICFNPGLQNNTTTYGSLISAYEGNSNMHIYNNYGGNATLQGIQVLISNVQSDTYAPYVAAEPQVCHAYNNVIYNTGTLTASRGHGITVANDSSVIKTLGYIYNNTVANAAANGVRTGSSSAGGILKDNVLADCVTPVSAGGGASSVNNLSGTTASMQFVNAASRNYRLTVNSPAKDTGTTPVFPFTTFDHDDVARPQGAAYCRGAFEYKVT